MQDYKSSLLREKFTLYDPNSATKDGAPLVALSNRYVLELRHGSGKILETLVIRTQNMHSCVRFAARILQSFYMGGSILNRAAPFDWDAAWNSITSDYEQKFNPDLWAAVYAYGQVVFESGKRHPFLDMIEKCDNENSDDYDFSVPLAEAAFLAAGKAVKIEHDSNVALVTTFTENEGRCGIILRGPNNTKTFTFTARAKPDQDFNQARCLTAGAAFLEGIQLCFMIGLQNEKSKRGMVERFSDEEKKTREARRRAGTLDKGITGFEDHYNVRYRPEKPIFREIINDTMELMGKNFEEEEDDTSSTPSSQEDD